MSIDFCEKSGIINIIDIIKFKGERKMDINKIWDEMTFEEKANLLTGDENTCTNAFERFGIEAQAMMDGPHGVRLDKGKNCTHFPNVCNLASSWSKEASRMMGSAIAQDCIKHDIKMLLGPGINIKRNILCGRNFEYFSEDPVLTGELASEYVIGLQEKGVSACVKHYAVNNQEEGRTYVSAEIDERTLREIYIKAFEMIVKKAKPDSIMCSYNKINAIWGSENKELLHNILKDEWGFEGMVVSDWGAVQSISRSVAAGLDMQMPCNKNIAEELRRGLDAGLVTMEDIKRAGLRMLKFIDRKPLPQIEYNRDNQHEIAKSIASEGMVLLKNDNNVLPITKEKYKKIAIIGEYANDPLIAGQGSGAVFNAPEYSKRPLDEIKKRIPEIELKYIEGYKKSEYSKEMLWPMMAQITMEIQDCDLVVFFAGAMESEDTENFDRLSARINPNQEFFMNTVKNSGKKVVTVLQNGGALVLGHQIQRMDAILEMWLGGEGAGEAVADILCAIVNPSGKLAETFPTKMRADLDFPGNGMYVDYKEKLDVGYRYYDKHPEEIVYPFGHGLSYTSFEYSDLKIDEKEKTVEFILKNTGEVDGKEVVQLYIGDPVSTVVKPVKELKRFEKVFLKAGEKKKIQFKLTEDDFSYFNVMLHKWVAENGEYVIYIGSSSRDIRLSGSLNYNEDMPYSLEQVSDSMLIMM